MSDINSYFCPEVDLNSQGLANRIFFVILMEQQELKTALGKQQINVRIA